MSNDLAAADLFAGPALIRTAPTTDPQREIWTATRLGLEASLAFNESITLRFEGDLDVTALRGAISDLVARHEALHTTFSGEGPTLCVTEAVAPELPVLDWSSATDPESLFRDLIAREVEEPFDLERGPLFRLRLARFSPREHRLTFTAHHIVCDGWSSAVLVKDLAALYSARRSGVPAQLPPAEVFSDYARARGEAARFAQRDADERYWLEQFAGEIPVLELPTDRPRPPLKTYRSRREDATLDAELIGRLRRVAARERASLFNLLLAGWQTLLHRLSGQEDLVVGIPAAGQAAEGRHGLVGHCVSLLPVRSRPRATQPFRELLASARSGLFDALEHQQLTYGALLQKLPLSRDPSRLPLVSVLFNLDKALAPGAMKFEELRVELSTNPRHFENADLFLNAVELENAVSLECQFNTNLFDAATVRRWLAAYECLLRSVADDPGCQLGALPIVSEAERELIRSWNQTDAPFPREASVHHLIEDQCRRTPDAVAVELDGRRLRYRELDARANQLARRLRALGVREDALVGLCVDRSIDMVVALLGILKAGGAYVPLDPGYPPERLAFMVEDSRMGLLVTERRLRGAFAMPPERIVCLDDEEVLRESDAPLERAQAAPESAAYVIYTSGSTGKPKGVVVPHRSVVNLLASVQRRPGISERDVVLAVTTLSFDIAVSEIILPLTVGARIVLATREVVQDGARLLQLLRESKATFLDATPATWRLLLAAGWEGGEGLKAICTGEALPKDLALELVPRVARLWNGYGPTETTVWSAFHRVAAPVERILIGKPVANTQIHILDSRGQPMPIGVPGELYIGGAGVTRGYLNRPELTAERFVPDPFRAEPGARMYRTGDVARWLADGNLDYLGRNDNQVKLRGYRIELGEIEHALSRHPDVAHAAALVREDRAGDKRLVAYVVPQRGRAPDEAQLRAFLKGTLPDYMVPASILRLAALPLTPSGKVDRKALPAPEQPKPDAASFVAPRPGTETMIAAAFQEALGIGRLSANDDFFALGGHSLLASEVLARLRRDHGLNVSFRALFEAPTAARLAAYVESQGLLAAAAKPEGIPRHAGPQPLSLMQERLWLLEEMDERQRAVHALPAAWRMKGPLDIAVLERSLRAMVQRHQTLRTWLRMEDGGPAPQVANEAELPLERKDLSGTPQAEREAALTSLLEEESRRAIDLSRPPLMRAVLVRLDTLDHALFILPHNLIWDGWSFDIFLRELSALYSAFVAGGASPLEPLPIQYGDFAAWHRGWLAGPEADRQRRWWLDRLGGEVPLLALPTDRPRDVKAGLEAGNAGLLLPRELSDALTALGREQGATLFMVLFSAFNVLLHRYTGQTDLLVATPVRARTRAETEDLIGLFINALALRTQLSPSWTFAELVAHVREQTLDAFSHQDLPLEALGNRAPTVRAFFSLQDARTRPLQMGGLAVTQIHVPPTGAASEFTLWMMESAHGLFAMLNFRRDLYDAPMMERLLGQFRALLESVAAGPRRPVSQLPMAPKDEAEVVRRWSAPEATMPAAGVHEIVVAALGRAPTSAALRRGALALSAGELSERAGRLARDLRQRGAAGANVALLLPPGFERTVALVGALEAGAAVVPLDPEHPPARLATLLGDAAPVVVVTTAQLRDRVPAGVAVVLLDTPPPGAAGTSAGPVPFTPDSSALVVYEAAGKPEARKVPHGPLAAAMAAAACELRLSEADLLLAAAPLSTGLSLLEILLPLGAGASVAIADPALALDGAALRDELARTGATVLAAPAPTWRRLIAAGWQGGPSFKAICTGAPPSARLAGDLSARAGQAFAAYGYAEAGIWSLFERLGGRDGRASLGRPLAGQRVSVVDPYGQPAPVGVPGLLQLGNSRRGERARWLSDGRVELLAGEPGVVEARGVAAKLDATAEVLRSHGSVADAAVIAGEDRFGDARLAALVVKRRDRPATDTELRRHLRREVPEPLVPQIFVEVDSLLRGPAGELDRRSLPDPFAPAGEEAPLPRTEAERLVADLWREALGVASARVHDNFFDLGGTSLLCFHVVAGVEKATGVRLSPRVFLLDTLEQAARRIADAMPAGPRSRRAPGDPTGGTA